MDEIIKYAAVLILLALSRSPFTSFAAEQLDWIRPSADKTHFVSGPPAKRIEMWGFNYDRDHGGRLLEDFGPRNGTPSQKTFVR